MENATSDATTLALVVENPEGETSATDDPVTNKQFDNLPSNDIPVEQPPMKKIKLEEEEQHIFTTIEDQFTDAAVAADAVENTTTSIVDNNEPTATNATMIGSVGATIVSNIEEAVDIPPVVANIEKVETTIEAPVQEEEDLFGGEDDGVETNVESTLVSVTSNILDGNKSVDDTVVEDSKPDQPKEINRNPNEDKQIDHNNPSSVVVDSTPSTSVETPSKTELTIPRKSNSKQNSSIKPNSTPGTLYGLPVGVNVPFSIVRSKLLEAEMNTPGSKLMDVLKSLPINLINDALTEYDDAVEIKGSDSIRNHGAYLYGVVKRYVSVRDRFLNGDTTGTNPMGEDGLTSAVQVRLDKLVTSGFCSDQEMNDKVKIKIRMLSEKDAMFALDELSSVNRSQIRNFGSYFMGILNRYMRGEVSSKNRPSNVMNNNNHHGGGGSGSSNRHQQNNNQFRDRDRFSNSSNPSHTNQSSSSSYHNQSNSRNNRFENNRGPGNGGQQQQQQRPPFRMNNNSFVNDRNPQQQQQGTHMVPSWQKQPQQHPPQNQYMGTNMPNAMVPPMGSNMQGGPGMPPANFNYPSQQPPPQYPPQQLQQPTPYMQPQIYGQPQSYPPNNTNMYQPQQTGMMGQPYMGNQMSAQQQPPMMNQPSQFVPPSQAPGSIDILGLADKAASAIQALGANKLGQPLGQGYPQSQMVGPPQQQMGGPPQQQAYPNPYGPTPVMGHQQPNMSMPHQQQPPRPMQPGFPPQQMYSPSPQQQQLYGGPSGSSAMNQQAPQSHPHQNQQGSRRRTTATINDLPVNVQYALQNLIATGALDGTPDDGILGMILDLSETTALAGLQKFAAIDKSTMRNKFAYLAGVLRRELEGSQRR